MKENIIYSYFKLMRPNQWVKNGFVFATLLFSGQLFNIDKVILSFIGFCLFCVISSCVYIVNDIADRKADSQHIKKCNRPIASGKIKVYQAIIFLTILLVLSFGIAIKLDTNFFLILLTYLTINTAYSFWLKHIEILDIMSIAAGFVLRVVSGGILINEYISHWMILCTMFLSLFLGVSKRSSELKLIDNKGGSRKVLLKYSEDKLKHMTNIIDSCTIMCYSIYCVDDGSPQLMIVTIPFVLYGIFRYHFILEDTDLGESPDIALVKDIPLLVDIVLWIISCGLIFYL